MVEKNMQQRGRPWSGQIVALRILRLAPIPLPNLSMLL